MLVMATTTLPLIYWDRPLQLDQKWCNRDTPTYSRQNYTFCYLLSNYSVLELVKPTSSVNGALLNPYYISSYHRKKKAQICTRKASIPHSRIKMLEEHLSILRARQGTHNVLCASEILFFSIFSSFIQNWWFLDFESSFVVWPQLWPCNLISILAPVMDSVSNYVIWLFFLFERVSL